jgi:hypothetical protein
MKSLMLAILAVALVSSGCSTGSSSTRKSGGSLSEEEKHRLYSAALAATDSPIDTDTFKKACQQIGIFDAKGKPNDHYMSFVSQHVAWGTNSESDEFRREINSKEKAQAYIKQHLAQ